MPTCEELKIPIRLRQNGRESIQDFSKDLYLYRWFHPNTEYEYKGHISTAAVGSIFQPPFNISVNRSYFCEQPTDVLYNPKELTTLFNCGVMQASVDIVDNYTFPSILPDNTTIQIKLRLKHSPEPCMYPHSEILIFKNEKLIDKKINNKTLKADIRDELRKLFTVCHKPDSKFKPVEKTMLEQGFGRIMQAIREVFTG